MSRRELLRGLVPLALRERLRRLRREMQGPTQFESEYGPWRFVRDDDPAPRLTLVLPTVSRRWAFGGVATGMEVFCRLGARLAAAEGAALRVITTNPEPMEDAGVIVPAAAAVGLDPAAVALEDRRGKGAEVAARAREVFVAFNWHAALNLLALREAQAAAFGGGLRPLVQLLQEYEPGLYPYGADHALARMALDLERLGHGPIHAVVNAQLMADWLARQGHGFARTHVLAPRLPEAMRPFLTGAPGAPRPRARRVVVYGRPMVRRNGWPLLVRGLGLWAEAGFADWEVVSVGADHPPVPLAGRRRLTAAGKLSLEAYAGLLGGSAVGVSLMVSPHPSYPPLEMAHFGLRTLTTAYADKDLSGWHDNLVSLPDPRPETLAAALAEACRAFEADPSSGERAESRMTGYLDEGPWPFEAEAAAGIAAGWNG